MPILHIPVYHSLCAAVRMTNDKQQRSNLMTEGGYPRHQPLPTRKNSDTCQLHATQTILHRSSPRPEDSGGMLAAVEDGGTYSVLCSDSSIAAQYPAA